MLYLIISLFIFLNPLYAQSSYKSKTVGRVGERIITSRQVKIALVVEKIVEKSKFTSIFSDDISESVVNSVLLDEVIAKESETFAVASISLEEIERVKLQIEAEYKNQSEWLSLGVKTEELEDSIRRKLAAIKFLKFKTQSLRSEVTELEAKAYFEKNRIKFGNGQFENFKENIKVFLEKQHLQEKLKSWFEALRRKYKLKNFGQEMKS